MVIAVVLILLFVAFFMVRRHMGPGLLAAIAGVAVYDVFSAQLVEWLGGIGLGEGQLRALIFLVLVVGFPMLLYFKSSRGGMFGLIRIGEALVMSALLTSLLAPHIAQWFAFDELSNQIMNFINSVEGPIMMVGIGSAYLDILLYRG